MSGRAPSPDEPISYIVRLKERAFRDIDAAFVRFAEVVSESAALSWREGLTDAMAGLSTFPRKYPLAPERFGREVRQLLHRRPGSQIAYRILFTIADESHSLDPATVIVLHIRHAASRPPTRAQIREIESED